MTSLPSYCFRQAGIGTYTGNNVLGTPIVQATSKLLDQMIAWNLPEHIKGLPPPPFASTSRLTNYSRRISVFDAKL